MTRRWALAAMLAILPFSMLATGCGGSKAGSRAPVAVYATDNFDSDYDQVWATVRKVELIDAYSSAFTVFDEPSGRQIDLAGLAQSDGGLQYAFLGTADLEVRTYTKVRVTMEPSMTVVPDGSTTGTVHELSDSLPRDKNGMVQMTFDLDTPRTMGKVADDVVVDFDLTKFELLHGRIVPFLQEGSRVDLSKLANQAPFDYHGSISDLAGTSSAMTFNLKQNGRTMAVATDADTVVLQRESGDSKALANGARVEVYGVCDRTQRKIIAQAIKIEDAANEALYPNEMRGVAVCENSTNKTVTMDIHRTEGFRPEHARTIVGLTDGVVLQGPDGKAYGSVDAFMKAMQKGSIVDVEGVWNRTENTFDAKRIQIVDHAANPD
ncbi:MAG: DUF4382 domain-containing protein [Armatimonadota bacterium]